jgi:MATE family multidrug resistance protein
LATSVSSLVMAGVLGWLFRRSRGLREHAGVAAGAEGSREIFRVGLPVGLILLAEAGLFVLAALVMARFGDAAVAAYQIAINFASLLFMIPLGLGLATTVRVGHAAGAGDRDAVRHRGFVGMGLGLGNAASNAALMVAGGTLIARCYTREPGIAATAAHFLLLAAAFQFFDGLQVTANGALRGLKDTRLPMLITLVSYWLIGLPVAWWLAFRSGGGGIGPDGLWWGLTAGLGAAALGLSMRYAWQTRRRNPLPPLAAAE